MKSSSAMGTSVAISGALTLEHRVINGRESFTPLRPLNVVHPLTGPFVVEPGTMCFTSDLASVPWPFVWLIGRTGVHLRAAVIHDWLIHGLDRPGSPCSNRVIADRVFVDLMAADGVRAGRRHLIGLAVSIATVVAKQAGPLRSLLVVVAALIPAVVILPATMIVVGTRLALELVERILAVSVAVGRRLGFVRGGGGGQLDGRRRDESFDCREGEAA